MGLIKTGLKAAVAVKVAHMVHDRIEERKQAQWVATGHPGAVPGPSGHPGAMAAPAGPPQATAATAASAPGGDMLDQLAKLGELKAAGVLTEAEFQAQKTRILNS
jgi:hypothetical protein